MSRTKPSTRLASVAEPMEPSAPTTWRSTAGGSLTLKSPPEYGKIREIHRAWSTPDRRGPEPGEGPPTANSTDGDRGFADRRAPASCEGAPTANIRSFRGKYE